MGRGVAFRARRERGAGWEAVVLAHDGAGRPERAMEAWIVPDFGSNLCRFVVGGRRVIDFDPQLLLAHDYTGTPVLYPTPNRVRGGLLRWQGREYPQTKGGVRILEHGLVHGERWRSGEAQVEKTSVFLETWIDFQAGEAVFEAFPFPHRLKLRFVLGEAEVRVHYELENLGTEDIPFGFGLHPYFSKLGGDRETFVSLPAEAVMEATVELLPTGQLIDVAGTALDLRRPVSIGSLDLDHVFTRIAPGEFSRIEHRNLGMNVTLEATEEFSHLVLYSPQGENFFCIENQTCSTDAHNLFDRGFVAESGLKTVAPGAVHRGGVSYSVSW